MNKRLQTILDQLQKSESLTPEEKRSLIDALKESDKEITITEFKLERTEKVKRTTAILLEETIAELEEKRKAVEAQNRELEIEVSLERVRAQAMGMHHSDELGEVLSVLFAQFDLLGITPLYTFLSLIDLDKNTFDYRQTGKGGTRVIAKQVIDLNSMVEWKELFENMRAGKFEPISCVYFPKESLEKVWEVFGEIYAALPEGSKVYPEDFPDGAYTTQAYCKFGYIGFDHTREATEEEKGILLRFAKEFERTYTRFLDLQKAEAQAKEAQIEAALERVRSKSIAMHQSSELGDLSFELVKQVQALGIATWHCAFNIYDEGQKSSTEWGSNANGTYPIYKTPREGIFKRYYEIGQKGETLHVEVIGEDRCADHYAYLCTLPGVGETLIRLRDSGVSFPKSQIDHVAYFKYGYLLFITFEPAPEAHDVFKRFAKVFEQTYTRFLDLQKAEAQAREAQIEAALERVRSRSMGMQKSDELREIIQVVYEQFIQLGFNINSAGFATDYMESDDFSCWFADSYSVFPNKVHIPYFDHPQFNRLKEAKEKGLEFYANRLTFEEKNKFFDHVLKHSPPVPQELKEVFYSATGYITSHVLLKNVILYILNLTDIPFSEATNAILMRFGKVFEQTYTRFLDLQKAEAQAREAKIENALEKVRSRTMAMQRSEELIDAASVLFQQVKALGVPQWNCGFNIWDIGDKEFTFYAGTPDGIIVPAPCKIPLTEHPVFRRFDESRRRGDDLLIYEKEGEEQRDHYQYMLSLRPGVGDVLQNMLDGGFQFPKFQIDHVANFAYGNLIFITYEPFPEMHDVFKRFAKVFEQTYTRFLDLQKAEAQAREAKIEAGLERVRSRAMAMRTSEELNALIGTVFTELTKLDLVLTRCVIMTYDLKTHDARWWMANSEAPEQPMNFFVQYHEHPPNLAYFSAWRELTVKWIYALEGTIKKEWDDFLFNETELKLLPDFVIAGMKAPDRVYLNASFYNSGNLTLASLEPLSDEHFDILIRFAKVFDLTYTRFNDLKQAEAQTWEAKIEAALERVRSRTMAMQRSDELLDVASILFQQVKDLGVPQWDCGFGIWDIGDRELTYYPGTQGGVFRSTSFSFPLTEHPVFISIDESRKRGDELFVYEKEGEFQADHYRYMLSLRPGAGDLLQSMLDAGLQFPTFQIDHVANFSYGCLIFITYEHFPKMHDVFKRFAKVFEQTYTRFLDLQKAEAQAREAQIESALERVRSRSMAMHHSEELLQVITVVSEQLQNLNFKFNTVSFATLNQEHDYKFWFAIMGSPTPLYIQVPYVDSPMFSRFKEVFASGATFYTDTLTPEENRHWHEHVFAHADFSFLSEETKDYVLRSGYARSVAITPSIMLIVSNYAARPFSDEQNNIIKRFAVVFEQSYTRFLDLQKAEAQAREARIETALERVRSKTMAMHHSEELKEVIAVTFEQIKSLDIVIDSCIITLFIEGSDDLNNWVTSAEQKYPQLVRVPYFKHPMFDKIALAKKKPGSYFTLKLSKEENKQFYTHLLANSEFGKIINEERKAVVMNAESNIMSFANFKHTGLRVGNFHDYSYTPAENNTILRFANVFEQTYTRFLDLQKAEAQAREAQIEASLERVRSRSLAMHKSDELAFVVDELFLRLKELEIGFDSVNILQFTEDSFQIWAAYQPGKFTVTKIPYSKTDIPYVRTAVEAKNRGQQLFTHQYLFEEKNLFLRYLFEETHFINLPEERKQFLLKAPCYTVSIGFAKNTALQLQSYSRAAFSESENALLLRFVNVFEQCYTRFLDLQKAEAQAREAQIEVSLERVRSKAMAMHKSEDLTSAVAVVFDELEKLDLGMSRCGIGILSKKKRTGDIWTTSKTEGQTTVHVSGVESMDIHPLLQHAFDAWLRQEDFTYVLRGQDLADYYSAIQHANFLLPESQSMVKNAEMLEQHYHTTTFQAGALYAFRENSFTDEAKNVMKRFANVFSLTYKRFQDIQKAEAQAREATIEAALEKVRGKAMAMHNSNDLIATASLVFTELRKLGIDSFRSGVGLLTKENSNAKLYSATTSTEGDNLSLVGWAALEGHVVLSEIYKTWLDNKDYFPVLKGDLLTSYYEKINSNFAVPTAQSEGLEQYGCFLPFSEGTFYGWSKKPYTELEIRILHRFKAIIDLTFRRYIELQKSEANAMEAIRQASLDRVRAEIASMRTTSDLDRITPLIWKELNTLNVPFVRCGVFIMDDPQQQIHTFLSTPDGRAIAAFHLPYDAPGNVGEILSHWQKNETYISHWDRTAFSELGELLVQQGAIPTIDGYMNTIPGDGIYLHCLPFMQGMLYVGNTTELKEDEIHLIQSVADAFATAYARYEDFNKLEAAKQQVDKTLNDLKQTQNQLVISEKMASLGELTAGIAHEIQNPLNFVNNFSEVSNELLNEMNEEIERGNFKEVKSITDDIRKNLDKILHHGKRADGIVKGMLQHSRSSSGIKEPTDINVLADEYLRLAFHGFRAKDKSFNATTKTDFDESVGKISVVPQDIGRVVLNLITNAFFTVSEKKKQSSNEYEPTVTLKTRKQDGRVLISVIDNGNGISPKVLDKIFQPFFTTKPTGQGTGLGLSLSYDIVKAHGGEIRVETTQFEGARFIIQLPL